MPTPVSSFSPFTPFTPASSAQNTGGYFDRPAAGNIGLSSPLARRPDLRSNGVNSSSFLRMSRTSDTRQPSENGWRLASRMRDEIWSAWEQQLGNLSHNITSSINSSPKPSQPSNRPNLVHNNYEGIEPDKDKAAGFEGMKISSNPLRSGSELNIPDTAPGPCRSISSNGQARPAKLMIHRKSFDPSFFAKHARSNETEHVSAN